MRHPCRSFIGGNKSRTHLLIREDVTQRLTPQVFSWEKKSLVVGLKGVDAKTN
jgi:hypothetical protein